MSESSEEYVDCVHVDELSALGSVEVELDGVGGVGVLGLVQLCCIPPGIVHPVDSGVGEGGVVSLWY